LIRIVQFSGGKDSTALVLWAREQWGDDFTPVFCDTGWEHALTYEYVEHRGFQLRRAVGCLVATFTAKRYPTGMVELCSTTRSQCASGQVAGSARSELNTSRRR
jgi:tRNA(Ile)-lysidine synthase TilS/MesJ